MDKKLRHAVLADRAAPQTHIPPHRALRTIIVIAASLITAGVLFWTSRQNYLLFHSLVELSSVAVAWGVFMIVWNSRRFIDNQALVALGIAFFFIGLLALLHMLAYRGMRVLADPQDASPATQLWIASRYLQALAFLGFPLILGRSPSPPIVFALLTVVTSLMLGAIFAWRVFPVCFVEGQGLTAFKIASEYIVCAIMAGGLLLLLRSRPALDDDVRRLLALAVGFTIAAGLSFTIYADVYGLSNVIGHLLNFASFGMVYTGLIRMGLTRPYALLYRELAQSQAALFQERSMMQAVLAATPDFLVMKDRRSICRKVNPAFCRFLGKSEEEIIGKKDAELFAPGEAGLYAQGDAEVMATGRPEIGDWPVSGQNGRRWLQVIKTPVHGGEGGDVSGVLCSVRDVTDRKRMERLLQARVRLSESAYSKSEPDLLQEILDETEKLTESRIGFLHFVEADQETLRLQMWSTNTLSGICTAEGSGKHYPVSQAGVWVDCLRQRKPVIHNDYAALPHRKGTPPGHAPIARELVVPILQNELVVAILGVGNKAIDYTQEDVDLVTELGGMAWDLVVRKRAEDELRSSQEHYRLVADFTYDWEYWVDPAGKYRYVSPSCERVSGYPPSYFMENAEAFVDIVHPEDHHILAAHLQDIETATERTCELAFRIIRKDGEVRWVQHTCWGVFTQSGVFAGRRGSQRDITERRQANQEKEKLETQLMQAQKMEAIGTLAGGIAHDFNNILGVINGNAEMLMMDARAYPSLQENISPILAASNRAKKLVSQILTFSRQGQQEKMLINLKAVVKETIGFLRSSLPATIRLDHFLSPQPGAILADPTQMQQILMNLCTNAAHAMEDGGGILKIELDNVTVSEADQLLAAELGPGNYVRLSVSDTGHGMAAWVRERIFDPYFTTKEPGKGTGLGLSVVHGIVKAHGGSIRVYSEPGKGTIFHVYFPRTDGVEKTEGQTERFLPRGTERILLVDDEAALADIGKRMLGFLGYRVEVRTSPVEALELFRTAPERFDAVIADMTMPQMTGLALVREILAIRPDIPTMICTGFSEQANEAKARSAGIRAFLFKPIVIADLAKELRRVIDQR